MDDLDAWIGRTSVTRAALDPGQANHLAVTLDREPAFAEGDALPPAWHWLYFHDLVRDGELGPDGHARPGVLLPALGLPRRMWAGGSISFERPVPLGAAAQRRSTIASITPKEGRSGRLCFVEVDHEVLVGGETAIRERQSIVYREAADPAGAVPAPGPAPADADTTREWRPTAVLLFRYSALTFNGHRIHYDERYCREVEGYPGVVVHGPLIATLLLDHAVTTGRPVRRFAYRATSPLFLPHPFTVNARVDGDATRLWAASHDGGLAMEAELTNG